MLADLAAELHHAIGIRQKRDIQPIAQKLGAYVSHAPTQSPIWIGDDCAAIPDGDSYLLLASEGMWPTLVEAEPWFAGWCAVLVNVSDIYAMGGRPIAVVDALWSPSTANAQLLWEGMMAASQVFQVPIVGGHTNCHSPYAALSVAILGRAHHLITSFQAQPNDILLLVTDFNGQTHSTYPFWDAATHADPIVLRSKLELLPQLAAAELCDTGKDISMGGIIGTTLMLLETSGCGAVLTLDTIPCPETLSLHRWLTSFPSYGFLLSVRPDHVRPVQSRCQSQDLVCEAIGTITSDRTLMLQFDRESVCFWDFTQDSLTGFTHHS